MGLISPNIDCMNRMNLFPVFFYTPERSRSHGLLGDDVPHIWDHSLWGCWTLDGINGSPVNIHGSAMEIPGLLPWMMNLIHHQVTKLQLLDQGWCPTPGCCRFYVPRWHRDLNRFLEMDQKGWFTHEMDTSRCRKSSAFSRHPGVGNPHRETTQLPSK